MKRAIFLMVLSLMAVPLLLSFASGTGSGPDTATTPSSAKSSSLAATQAAAPSPSVKARELSFSTYTSSEHHLTKAYTAWAKEIEQQTGGRIKITIFPGETLTKAAQIYDGAAKGISDIGFSALAYTPGRFPLMELGDLSYPEMKNSVQASRADWEVYKKFKPKEFDEVKLLHLFCMGVCFLHSNKEIRSLDNVANQQIRCTGTDISIIKALGGTPVAMPMSESYLALQKGICDGILTNYGAMMSWKLGEVVKSSTESNLRCSSFFLAMNLKVWNSLSPDLQKIFTDVSEKYVEGVGKYQDDADKAGREYVLGLGHKVIELPSAEQERFQKALAPLRDEYVKAKSALGLPAKEALEYMLTMIKK